MGALLRRADEQTVFRCASVIRVGSLPLPGVVQVGRGNGSPGLELGNAEYSESRHSVVTSFLALKPKKPGYEHSALWIAAHYAMLLQRQKIIWPPSFRGGLFSGAAGASGTFSG